MLCMVLFLLLSLSGCGECEHEYDDGVISREPTCMEEGAKTYTCSLCGEIKTESVEKKEHTYKEEITKEPSYTENGEKNFSCMNCDDLYTESIPALDAEPYNQSIYEQMLKFCDNGDYIEALIVGRDAIDTRDAYTILFGTDSEYAVNSKDDAKARIDDLTREIFNVHAEYIKEQIQCAIENSDYEIFDTLYYYKGLGYQYGYQVVFSSAQEWAYVFTRELQGEYRYFESTDRSIQLEIEKFNLKMGDKEYILNFKFVPEWDSEYKEPRFVFENGIIEEIRTGLIAITYKDGTCIKYQSDAGEEWEERQKQREEEKKQNEEKRKQEYLANEPKIGMTADEVKASNWGNPEKINKTTYEWGVTEQWCYPDYKYIYFEDGIVTAIQDHN